MKIFADTIMAVMALLLVIPIALMFAVLIYLKFFMSLPELIEALVQCRIENNNKRKMS